MSDEKKDPENEIKRADKLGEPRIKIEDPEIPQVLPDETWSTERLAQAAVEDKNMLVRSNAVMILANRPEQVAVEAMIQAMKDREYVVKSSATVKLASRGKEILDRMISALEDSDDEIRAGAAWVLGELKDQKAVEPLRKASQDENPVVRIQAKASLMAMGLLNKEAKEAPGS